MCYVWLIKGFYFYEINQCKPCPSTSGKYGMIATTGRRHKYVNDWVLSEPIKKTSSKWKYFPCFRFTFAKPGAVFRKEDMTIYSKVNYEEVLGNRNGLSNTDVFRVNKHYVCPPSTASTASTTTNDPVTIIENIKTTDRVTSSDGSSVTIESILTLMQAIFILYQLIKLLFWEEKYLI